MSSVTTSKVLRRQHLDGQRIRNARPGREQNFTSA
jgi:hypothetical protein